MQKDIRVDSRMVLVDICFPYRVLRHKVPTFILFDALLSNILFKFTGTTVWGIGKMLNYSLRFNINKHENWNNRHKRFLFALRNNYKMNRFQYWNTAKSLV